MYFVNSRIEELKIESILNDFGYEIEEGDINFISYALKDGEYEDVESLLSPKLEEEDVKGIIHKLKQEFHPSVYKDEEENKICSLIKLEREEESFESYMARTYSTDTKTRLKALREFCPCHVKKDFDILWKRIIELKDDPEPSIRYQVVHNLADGSPVSREMEVISALKEMQAVETDPKVKNAVNKILSNYDRSGKWNIM